MVGKEKGVFCRKGGVFVMQARQRVCTIDNQKCVLLRVRDYGAYFRQRRIAVCKFQSRWCF